MIEPAMPRAVIDLSRLWLEANPQGWFATLDAARAQGRTLLEVIRDRYLTVRDELAREAFDRQTTVAAVARERLNALRDQRRYNRYKVYLPEIIGPQLAFPVAGGKWGQS